MNTKKIKMSKNKKNVFFFWFESSMSANIRIRPLQIRSRAKSYLGREPL